MDTQEKNKVSLSERKGILVMWGCFGDLCVIFAVVPTFTCHELHRESTFDLLELHSLWDCACGLCSYITWWQKMYILRYWWGVWRRRWRRGGGRAGETWLDRGSLDNWEEDLYLAHLKLSSWVFLKKQPQCISESVWNFKAWES